MKNRFVAQAGHKLYHIRTIKQATEEEFGKLIREAIKNYSLDRKNISASNLC